MPYTFQKIEATQKSIRFHVRLEDQVLNNHAVLKAWEQDSKFRSSYSQFLADVSFSGAFWECPPFTKNNLGEPFECMLIDSPNVGSLQADISPFREMVLQDKHDQVAVFPNLGRNAMLVAPKPLNGIEQYAHFLEFLRTAPPDQVHQLWIRVSETMFQVLNDEPTWLSTSGLGVYWLHIRLDTYPKYYVHRPYKEWMYR